MGSCVSMHKNPDSAMKFDLGFRSNNDKTVIPTPVTVNDKPLDDADSAVKSQWSTTPNNLMMASRDFGSKEEAFFDSQPWLESDCEDDFFSVNGDFTPSRGNTPVHPSFSAGTPGGNRSPFLGRNTRKFMPSSSPAAAVDKKKKLFDLFKESAPDNDDEIDDIKERKNAIGIEKGSNSVQIPPKSTDDNNNNTTPFVSGVNSVCSNLSSSSERSPNAAMKSQAGEKSLKSVQCCIPNLLSNRSFSERKKKISVVGV